MLTLDRREGQQVVIGDDVVITVVEVRGGCKVRLGIEAPKDIPVHRLEVYREILREGRAAPLKGGL